MPSLIRSIRKESANRRIGIKRPCLQHEARDDDHGCRRITGGNAGVRPGSARENQRLQEASGRVWAVLRFDSVESESRGGAECAVTPQCAPPTLFSHGLGQKRTHALQHKNLYSITSSAMVSTRMNGHRRCLWGLRIYANGRKRAVPA